MKQVFLTISIISLFFAGCNNAENKTTDTPLADSAAKMAEATVPMDSAAMMKAWEQFATPSENHKWMEKMNGTWDADVSQWMSPDAPPTMAKATNIQSSILGGRYVIGKYSSSMMGMPFEGMSTMGYDNAKKLYVSTWVDNMGTGIIHMSGNYDEASKTLNLKGLQTDPMTGKDMNVREELKIIDDNSYMFAMYGDGMDGKEMKFMEAKFTKKK